MIGFTINFFEKKSKISEFFYVIALCLAFFYFFLRYIDPFIISIFELIAPFISSIFALIAKNPFVGIWWSSYTGFIIFGFWLKFNPESRFGKCMFGIFVWLICIFLPLALFEYDDLKFWLRQSEFSTLLIYAYFLGVGYLTKFFFQRIIYFLFENKSSRKNPENPRITRSKD